MRYLLKRLQVQAPTGTRPDTLQARPHEECTYASMCKLTQPVSTISSHIQLRAGRSAGSSQSLNTRPLLFATAGARWPAISRALVVPPPPCLLREIEWEILRFSDPR